MTTTSSRAAADGDDDDSRDALVPSLLNTSSKPSHDDDEPASASKPVRGKRSPKKKAKRQLGGGRSSGGGVTKTIQKPKTAALGKDTAKIYVAWQLRAIAFVESLTLETLRSFVKDKVRSAPRIYNQVTKVKDSVNKALPEGAAIPADPETVRHWEGHLDTVKLLIEHNADLRAVDKDGTTAAMQGRTV